MHVRTAAAIMSAFIAMPSVDAYGGIFGSSNYEECVVDKMKGQPANMVSLVAQACRKQFPPEEMLVEGQNYRKGQFVAKWSATSKDTISAAISQNDTKYALTKAEGSFWKLGCDQHLGNPEPDIEVSAEAPLFGSTFDFKIINAVEYHCGMVLYYGRKK